MSGPGHLTRAAFMGASSFRSLDAIDREIEHGMPQPFRVALEPIRYVISVCRDDPLRVPYLRLQQRLDVMEDRVQMKDANLQLLMVPLNDSLAPYQIPCVDLFRIAIETSIHFHNFTPYANFHP